MKVLILLGFILSSVNASASEDSPMMKVITCSQSTNPQIPSLIEIYRPMTQIRQNQNNGVAWLTAEVKMSKELIGKIGFSAEVSFKDFAYDLAFKNIDGQDVSFRVNFKSTGNPLASNAMGTLFDKYEEIEGMMDCHLDALDF